MRARLGVSLFSASVHLLLESAYGGVRACNRAHLASLHRGVSILSISPNAAKRLLLRKPNCATVITRPHDSASFRALTRHDTQTALQMPSLART